jgi:hypothetical protein
MIQGTRYRQASRVSVDAPSSPRPVRLGSVGPKGGSAMLVSRSHRDERPGLRFLHRIPSNHGVPDNLPNEVSWMRGFPRLDDKAIQRFERPWLIARRHASLWW